MFGFFKKRISDPISAKQARELMSEYEQQFDLQQKRYIDKELVIIYQFIFQGIHECVINRSNAFTLRIRNNPSIRSIQYTEIKEDLIAEIGLGKNLYPQIHYLCDQLITFFKEYEYKIELDVGVEYSILMFRW